MLPKRDNYVLQAEAARLRFLTYDQQAMPVEKDADFLHLPFCGVPYRISRADGHIFRLETGRWVPADSHGEVLTLFDYLCDAKPHRRAAGEFVSLASLGNHVHTSLSIHSGDLEKAIDAAPAAFCRSCETLGGIPAEGGDLCFDLKLFPDLPVRLRFWHGDDEFPPVLDILWDRNATNFLRYETLWYAAGVLRSHVSRTMLD